MRAPQNQDDFFTSPYLVQVMCDRSEPLISDIHKKVFEPGCGTGNFLVEILQRRLRKIKPTQDGQMKALVALSNMYGLDIQSGYISTARQRLKATIESHFGNYLLDYRFLPLVDLFLQRNFLVADCLEQPEKIQFTDWQPTAPFLFASNNTTLQRLL